MIRYTRVHELGCSCVDDSTSDEQELTAAPARGKRTVRRGCQRSKVKDSRTGYTSKDLAGAGADTERLAFAHKAIILRPTASSQFFIFLLLHTFI